MEAITTVFATMKFAAAKFSIVKASSVLAFIAGGLITLGGALLVDTK